MPVSDSQSVARAIYRAAARYHAGGPILLAAYGQSRSSSAGELAVARLPSRIQYLRRAIHGKSSHVANPITLAVTFNATRQSELHVSNATGQPGGPAHRKPAIVESPRRPGETRVVAALGCILYHHDVIRCGSGGGAERGAAG